jgi:hypothetical protein
MLSLFLGLETLGQAVAKGYKDVDRLKKDKDLDPLRAHRFPESGPGAATGQAKQSSSTEAEGVMRWKAPWSP